MTIIAKGTPTWAEVSHESTRAKIGGRGGTLILTVYQVLDLTGENVAMKWEEEAKGSDLECGEEACLFLLPLLLVLKGNHAVIPRGTTLTARVFEDQYIDTFRLEKAGAALAEKRQRDCGKG